MLHVRGDTLIDLPQKFIERRDDAVEGKIPQRALLTGDPIASRRCALLTNLPVSHSRCRCLARYNRFHCG